MAPAGTLGVGAGSGQGRAKWGGIGATMSQATAALDPKRTVAELKELRALTGNADGAQRVAFTPSWAAARKWMREKLAELPLEVHQDAGGNVWATLKGQSPRELLI